jgi:hypothetical protein
VNVTIERRPGDLQTVGCPGRGRVVGGKYRKIFADWQGGKERNFEKEGLL